MANETSKLDITNSDDLIFRQVSESELTQITGKKANSAYVGDIWLFLCFRTLLLSSEYKDYCIAHFNDDKEVISQTEKRYKNISVVYNYWGYVAIEAALIDSTSMPDITNYAHLYDRWLLCSGDKTVGLYVNAAQLYREGGGIKIEKYNMYIGLPDESHINDFHNKHEVKITAILNKAMTRINKELGKLLPFNLKQANPEQSLARLIEVEQRLDVYYLREELGLTTREALLEIYKSNKKCWQLIKASVNSKFKENAEQIIIGKLKPHTDNLDDEVEAIATRLREAKNQIDQCLNDNFPSIAKLRKHKAK
jgi:hypothetical protein